jgi:hypothetical protein
MAARGRAAEEYLETSIVMPGKGVNLLPMALEDVICRINRKRGSTSRAFRFIIEI